MTWVAWIAWIGAIQLQRKSIILAVKTALYNFLFHQVKAKRVPNTVTAAYSNLRPVANEISSVQPYSDSCMNISFLRLPSHIPVVHVLPIMLSSVKFTLKKKSKDEGLSYPC